jgi:hypothetical protein
VITIFSTLLVLWARTRPSYDAYGWLVWGYQTLHLKLDLGGAPSWKPLPYLFTVPFALFGHYQMWLWMIFDAAVSFAGAVFAGRIAYRLTGGSELRARAESPIARSAPIAAAIFAGAAVLGLEDYMHYILSAQSDPAIVTLCLAAVDMHLIGRYRWAYVFAALAALGRPEVWPFTGLYTLWAFFRVPSMRWMLCAGTALIAFMWFGVPTITNGRPDIAGQLAQGSPRELRSNRFFGVLGRFKELQYLPIWIAAALAVVIAVVRRNRVLLGLAAAAALWVLIEIAFAYHGWPGLSRYMFEPAAIAGVLAGVAVGWLLAELPRARRGLPRWAGIPIVAVLVATLVPPAIARLRNEHADLNHEHARTHQIILLKASTDALGGVGRVDSCGQPVTDVGYVSALAWLYHRNVGSVGGLQQHVMAAELLNPSLPKVIIKPRGLGGWVFEAWHTVPSKLAACSGL